jgi:hypothetical protein
MFHALIRAAKDFWLAYRRHKKSWEPETATEWRDFLARIAGKDPENGQKVMSLSNPKWVGTIVIQPFGPTGPIGKPKVSNTRDTRETAYKYLLSITPAASDFLRPPRDPGQRRRATGPNHAAA